MNLFGKDMIIGNFKLSDYGFMLASFDANSSDDEEDLGMDYETMEEYIGHNPVPVYLGSTYSNKLRPQVTIVKDHCNNSSAYFSEHECREVLRQLTGFRGYKTMQIYYYEFDELLYFNVRTVNASYKKIGSKVVAIMLQMECDSQFAWSKDFVNVYNATPSNPIMFCNSSDDLNHYLFPKVTITSNASISSLEIKNISANHWTTKINHISANEIITMDSKNEILTSSIPGRNVLNDFNMHFIRMIAGQNNIEVNSDVTITFEFRVPRKVGFICN